MTLQDAFLKALHSDKLKTVPGYSKATIAELKRNFKNDKVSTDRMRRCVRDCGGSLNTEEDWSLSLE